MVVQSHLPSFKRMMTFFDGENLAIRAKEILNSGRKFREGVIYQEDELIWHPQIIPQFSQIEIWRSTYYTSVSGSKDRVDEVAKTIRGLKFANHNGSALPNSPTPYVFWKVKNTKSKGVDIKMCADILSHVYQNNVDVVLFASGDADYLPVLKECIRQGKLVYLLSFSSGTSDKLLRYADHYTCLDEIMFTPNTGIV